MSGKGKGKRSRLTEQNGNGYHLTDEKRARRQNGSSADFKLSDKLLDSKTRSQLRAAWKFEGDEVETDSFRVIKKPFTCCVLNSFAQSPQAIDALIQELQDLEFSEKNNDLYKFKQSKDLKTEGCAGVESLRHLLATQVKSLLHEVTDIDFFPTIDMFCARYDYTDYLLCHDDELEGRRIAFIWYLVPPSWNAKDGGSLDLFDRDDEGQPRDVVKSLTPSRNAFVFFEVTPASFHQVSEVLTRDKTRLSIGGWFHAVGVERPPKYVEARTALQQPFDIDEDDFFAWINPLYLDPENQLEIHESFGTNSEICLKEFLAEEKYKEVCLALEGQDLTWKRNGPANKRSYESLPCSSSSEETPDVVQKCLAFLKSDAMFLLLSNLTGLNLHHLGPKDSDSSSSSSEDDDEGGEGDEEEEGGDDDDDEGDEEEDKEDKSPQASSSTGQNGKAAEEERRKKKKESDPRCHSEVRRWRQGSYTLIHDDDEEQSQFALDARLFFNCKEWSVECGGYSSYVARDEDEELLSAHPEENCLVLVYRDVDTLKFVKRVTDEIRKLPRKEFHDVAVTYFE